MQEPAAPPPPPGGENFELEGEAGGPQERSGWLGPLVLVPLGLVAAAVALFLFMSWMVSEPSGPADHLRNLLSGGTNARKQAYYSLGTALVEYRRGGRLDELPPGFEEDLAAAFDGAGEDDALVRLATAQALVLMESEQAFDRVSAMVQDARATGGRVEPSNPLESLGVVETRHLNPLTEGIRLLGELGDARAVPALEPFLADPDAGVRSIAAAALGGIADPSSAPALRRALQDEDREVRRNAAVSLAKQGDAAGEKVLEDMLSLDRYEGYRTPQYRDQAILFALEALAALKADAARPAVERLVDQIEGRVAERKANLQVASEARRWLAAQAAGWRQP